MRRQTERVSVVERPPATNSWQFPDLVVTEHRAIVGPVIGELYDVYRAAFAPLGDLAAARHLLDPAEFAEEMVAPEMTKFVAWAPNDEPVGIATMTNDLPKVPWISPDFYWSRYPDAARRKALYYFAYILVRPDLRDSRVFHRLTQVFTEIVAEARGVLCYDICNYNVTALRFADRIESFVKRRLGGKFEQVDTQSYYAMRFDE